MNWPPLENSQRDRMFNSVLSLERPDGYRAVFWPSMRVAVGGCPVIAGVRDDLRTATRNYICVNARIVRRKYADQGASVARERGQ